MKFPLSSDLSCDLDRLIYSKLLVQSNSGGGKSRTLRRILEQTFGKVQHLLLDPEGEFSTLREKFDYVLVAKTGGDVAADPRTARLLAERLLELHASAILDIFELSPRDRVLFVKEFLEGMVEAPKKLWHPALVVLDEAHVYCPEQGEAQSADAVKALTSRGRKRGFCAVLATQRISKLHKDTAAECNNVLIGRTGLDVDLKRACDNLGFSKADWPRLRDLEPGEFFAYGPALCQSPTLTKVGPVVTTHPEAGSKLSAAPAPPPTMKVRALLQKLSDLPQEVEEKKRTAEVMNRIIRDLEKKVRDLEARPSRDVVETVEVEVVKPQMLQRLEGIGKAWQTKAELLKAHAERLEALGRDLIATLDRVVRAKATPRVATEVGFRPVAGKGRWREAAPAEEAAIKAELTGIVQKAVGTATCNGQLTGPEKRIVDAIAWWNAACIEYPLQKAVAFKAGYSAKGSAYRNPRSHLNSMGLIRLNGDRVALTDAGRNLASAAHGTPTAETIQSQVLEMLPGPEQKLLQPILSAYPHPISQEEVAAAAGYEIKGSAYRNPRSRLRSLGLIDFVDGGLKAAPFLFLENDR